jgi:hypothetical protein
MRPDADTDARNCDNEDGDYAGAGASSLTSSSSRVDAIDCIRRNWHAEATRRKDVAQPALELVVAVVAHRLRT